MDDARCHTVLLPACGSNGRRADCRWLAGVWLLSVLYMSFFVYRGWIPVDEGLLAHTAERVLAGELPHRDFDDCYTGGQAFLHAVAFRTLGINLGSIRLVLFLAAVVVVPFYFSLARRAASPSVAGMCTLLCVAWSVPNYFAGMPSWYVLFLSILGLWAILRYFDTDRGQWLMLAGACGGLALVVKITGLYFVAAAGLGLVYREQRQAGERGSPDSPRSVVMLVLVAIVSLGFSGAVLSLLRRMWRPTELVYFALPAMVFSAVLLSVEWNVARGPAGRRLKRWFRDLGLFGLGAVAPVGCFMIPYLANGGLVDLYQGLFVLPAARFDYAALGMPGLVGFLPVALWAGPLVLVWRLAGRDRTIITTVILWAAAAFLWTGALWACRYPLMYDLVWFSMLNAVPVVSVIAGVACMPGGQQGGSAKGMERVFLLAVTAWMLSLQQFPFALAVYFFFVAPLLILAALHLVSRLPSAGRSVCVCVGGFYLAFAVLWLTPAFNVGFTGGYRAGARAMLSPRSSLRVPVGEAEQYEDVVRLVQQNSVPRSSILALPDCPEVYYLADRKNPTRRLYDFLTDVRERGRDVQQVIADGAIPVVVINLKPSHSPPVTKELMVQLRQRYRAGRRVSNFLVLWQPATIVESLMERGGVP